MFYGITLYNWAFLCCDNFMRLCAKLQVGVFSLIHLISKKQMRTPLRQKKRRLGFAFALIPRKQFLQSCIHFVCRASLVFYLITDSKKHVPYTVVNHVIFMRLQAGYVNIGQLFASHRYPLRCRFYCIRLFCLRS